MKCKYCGSDVEKRRNKFCDRDCYINYKRENETISKEVRNKMSKSLSETRKRNPDKFPSGVEHSRSVGRGTVGKYKRNNINGILELSSRTVTKVIKRMNLGCSRCGWDKATCDIHHINGRDGDNADSHENLCLLCPNCHREYHCGNFGKNELKPLIETIPENWQDYYYG
jgi:hypothetical protein